MAPFQHRNPFTVAAITSLYSSPFAEGFSIGQCQVAIQALLRYGAHEDGMHHHTKSLGSLHPAYAAFNPTDKTEGKVIHRMEVVEASLGDVFDVITLQDHLDSRLSVLIRCPGSDSPIAAEKLSVDVYITPHKVLGNECVSGDSAMLVQAFCQEFAIPHLQCFTERCKIESIRVPKPCCKSTRISLSFANFGAVGAEPISLSRPNHLPASHLSPSAAICETVNFIPSTRKLQSLGTLSTSLHQRSTCHCHPADAFLYPTTAISLEPISPVTAPDQSVLGLPLISVGPNMDAILDCFGLGDDLLPRLHVLVRTVCSSHWEVVLRATPWSLTYEQASNLSRVLLADIKGTPEFHIMTVFPLCHACALPWLLANSVSHSDTPRPLSEYP
ncbi:hypothetical protein PISMIDRAFT_118343 [Pisolithus microcarpus 441]|uniref:Uncharacterized protein n=1 Tax=Pisolithus microcarpus 441 TaxID=765257 RepID=A0A0C9Y9Z2_9AGAM|nr:hypothetical protein BKA83DRAFT_118343 [Pisolithus microcarpus]KIK13716.1 hypothetical protein PISMIDRAFT_118343 [Pisolithus microcarpus 441]